MMDFMRWCLAMALYYWPFGLGVLFLFWTILRRKQRIGRGWGPPGMILHSDGRAIGVSGGMFKRSTVLAEYASQYGGEPIPQGDSEEDKAIRARVAKHMRLVDQYNKWLDTPLGYL